MFSFLKNIGWPEIILIAIVLLIFFGSRKSKEISHELGKSVKEFKDTKKEAENAKEVTN